jgi:hypothetical protein
LKRAANNDLAGSVDTGANVMICKIFGSAEKWLFCILLHYYSYLGRKNDRFYFKNFNFSPKIGENRRK